MILVTGGMGFIGSAVCKQIVSLHDCPIINVDSLTLAANRRSLSAIEDHPGYNFIRADICDRVVLDAVFNQYKPAAVIHLAAENHVERSGAGTDALIMTNVVGTYQLLQAASHYLGRAPKKIRDNFRFIHLSTDEVYRPLGEDGLLHEDSPYAPSSPYAATKAAADHLAQAWFATYDLPVIIANCSSGFGPRQFPDQLIPRTIISALESKPLAIHGSGSNVRDWLHVDDLARGLVTLLERGRPGQTYHFGGGYERAELVVVQSICDTLDRMMPAHRSRRSLITFVADRAEAQVRYAADAAKARNELGWRPQLSFAGGLEQTTRWYLANRGWWQPLRERFDGEQATEFAAVG
jgi:dTDP-glucose 4,6-dehydratase